jgi:hypothetical protein
MMRPRAQDHSPLPGMLFFLRVIPAVMLVHQVVTR